MSNLHSIILYILIGFQVLSICSATSYHRLDLDQSGYLDADELAGSSTYVYRTSSSFSNCPNCEFDLRNCTSWGHMGGTPEQIECQFFSGILDEISPWNIEGALYHPSNEARIRNGTRLTSNLLFHLEPISPRTHFTSNLFHSRVRSSTQGMSFCTGDNGSHGWMSRSCEWLSKGTQTSPSHDVSLGSHNAAV